MLPHGFNFLLEEAEFWSKEGLNNFSYEKH